MSDSDNYEKLVIEKRAIDQQIYKLQEQSLNLHGTIRCMEDDFLRDATRPLGLELQYGLPVLATEGFRQYFAGASHYQLFWTVSGFDRDSKIIRLSGNMSGDVPSDYGNVVIEVSLEMALSMRLAFENGKERKS